MSDPIAVAVMGVGKIARDQHLPVIAADPDFRLTAAVSRNSEVDGVETFRTLDDLLAARPDVQAVALCTPPQGRAAVAATALRAGRHVLLEKPPGVGLAEVKALAELAEGCGRTLFAAWHSRFAPAVEPARAWLAGREVREVRIVWAEDVRRWHPGQTWIWEPGGLGVFDMGINALSIATRILPRSFALEHGEFRVPAGRQTPIAADLAYRDETGASVHLSLDWLRVGPPDWSVNVDTCDGELRLTDGGGALEIAGERVTLEGSPHAEYAGVYRRFAQLIRAGASEVDVAPLRHAADAFLCARRVEVEPFEE